MFGSRKKAADPAAQGTSVGAVMTIDEPKAVKRSWRPNVSMPSLIAPAYVLASLVIVALLALSVLLFQGNVTSDQIDNMFKGIGVLMGITIIVCVVGVFTDRG